MISLPAVQGWPYETINAALEEFKKTWRRKPSFLLVGGSLWVLLLHAADAEQFIAPGNTPIHLDILMILEPHEFMFVRYWLISKWFSAKVFPREPPLINQLAVCGLGKLGSPIAASFAKVGFHVTGYDLDVAK